MLLIAAENAYIYLSYRWILYLSIYLYRAITICMLCVHVHMRTHVLICEPMVIMLFACC